jgi:hypothetical protein
MSSVAALSKDGNLAASVADLGDVDTLKLHPLVQQVQAFQELLVDQGDSAAASEVDLMVDVIAGGLEVAFKTEEAMAEAAEEVLATKVVAVLHLGVGMVVVVVVAVGIDPDMVDTLHQMLPPAPVVVLADPVGMVEAAATADQALQIEIAQHQLGS